MGVVDWIAGLNRIKTRKDLPITISGGEPTLHPKFFEIIKWIDCDISLDLLTNGEFNVDEFIKNISPNRFKREAPYASIRFSYHPKRTRLLQLLKTVITLQDLNYSVGIWAVDKTKIRNRLIKILAGLLGIDFRIKDFLDNKHGSYKYQQALDGIPKDCLCKSSELLIAPDGRLFRCHYDLYNGVNSYGHILDNRISLPTDFLSCNHCGLCNPCDIKIKYDRFQKEGHCSVEIIG
jgi:MoaA/NifB/PqqE/SkfB family radical SAM enzyme